MSSLPGRGHVQEWPDVVVDNAAFRFEVLDLFGQGLMEASRDG